MLSAIAGCAAANNTTRHAIFRIDTIAVTMMPRFMAEEWARRTFGNSDASVRLPRPGGLMRLMRSIVALLALLLCAAPCLAQDALPGQVGPIAAPTTKVE